MFFFNFGFGWFGGGAAARQPPLGCAPASVPTVFCGSVPGTVKAKGEFRNASGKVKLMNGVENYAWKKKLRKKARYFGLNKDRNVVNQIYGSQNETYQQQHVDRMLRETPN